MMKNKYIYLSIVILIMEISIMIPEINKNLNFTKKIFLSQAVPESIFESEKKKEKLTSEFNNLSAIKFIFGTYKRKNTEILEFNLYDEKLNLLVKEKIETKNIKDNQEYVLKFKKIKDSKNKNYYFEINSLNGTTENSVAIYKEKNQIIYDLGYSSVYSNLVISSVIIFILCTNIFLILYLKKNKKIKKEKLFLILGSVYCTITLIIAPPYGINDENFHFYKAYAITAKQPAKNPAVLPKSVMKFSETINASEYINDREKVNLSYMKNATKIKLEKNDTEYVDSYGAALYNPISYIPQIFSIMIGSFFNMPIFVLFYLGRIIMLAIWLAIVFLAIKKAPEKIKDIILIVSLFPASVLESFPYSLDPLINSLTFLFISYFFRLYLNKNEKFNWRYGIIFFLGIFIPTIGKVPYFLLSLLLFLIPNEKFKNKKNQIFSISLIILITLLTSFLWEKISPPYVRTDIEDKILYLKSEPLGYIKIFYLTTKDYILSYMVNSVGILGWHDAPLPVIITYGYWILLFIKTFSTEIIEQKSKKFYIIILTILLGIYTLVLTALFVAWTPLGVNHIAGVQGRYFILIIPLLLILMSKEKIKLNNQVFDLNISLFLNFGLAYTMFCIIQRFYILM